MNLIASSLISGITNLLTFFGFDKGSIVSISPLFSVFKVSSTFDGSSKSYLPFCSIKKLLEN